MKIAYDAQIFFEQTYGGASRYICELATHISELKDFKVSITAPMHINAYLDHLPPQIVSGFRLPGTDHLALSARGIGMCFGDIMLRSISPDIIHETYYFPYRLGPHRARRVLTIHDMIHEKFSADFASTDRTARFKQMAAKRADHIICVSDSTRRDVIELMDISSDKISVIYHGFGIKHKAVPISANIEQHFDKPFILYVGNRGRYKNFSGLLKAYGTSTELKKHCRLICFGAGQFSADELETIKMYGLNGGHVIQIGGDDNVLAALYKSALTLVYPSLYEGFGFPPLEAMYFDCPVVCSDTSSIPEVIGDAGEYFDPNNFDSIRSKIELVVNSVSLRNELIEKGRERINNFSWEQCANETADVYRKLS